MSCAPISRCTEPSSDTRGARRGDSRVRASEVRPARYPSRPRPAPALGWAIALSLAATLLAGVLPEPVVALARAGAVWLAG